MAGMTTTLTKFAQNGDSITYTCPGHTASDPRLVLQKRRVPTGNKVMAESTVTVLYGTQDIAGANIAQRVGFSANAAYPITGVAADVTAALATFRDIVNSDEFAAMVTSQNPLK